MIKVLRVLLISLTAFFMTSFPLYAAEVIKIGGTGGAIGTMKIIGKAFEKKYPGFRVEFLMGIGSNGALRAVPEGAIDIGLSTWMLTEKQLSQGISAIQYAKTPFIFVTKAELKQNNITTQDIIKIYSGEKQSWPDGERIRWVLHPAGDSDTLVVERLSPEVKKALKTALSRRGILIAHTDQENLELIEKTPGAFGYTTLTQILSEKRPVKILSLNSIAPGVKTLADGSYPVFTALYIVVKNKQSDKLWKFIDFVMSEDGASILKETGNLAVKRK